MPSLHPLVSRPHTHISLPQPAFSLSCVSGLPGRASRNTALTNFGLPCASRWHCLGFFSGPRLGEHTDSIQHSLIWTCTAQKPKTQLLAPCYHILQHFQISSTQTSSSVDKHPGRGLARSQHPSVQYLRFSIFTRVCRQLQRGAAQAGGGPLWLSCW